MRYLVVTDIHGNLHALEAVLRDAELHRYEAVLCLGDLVGYGADPAAVIARTMALAPVGLIRGNHDKVCAGLEPALLFNDAARASAEWTQKVLPPEERQFLVDLPKGPQRITKDLVICHGAPFDEDHYIFDTGDAGRALAAADARLCLFGHTHLPAAFATADHPVLERGGRLQLPTDGPALINVGSVGQPRDGDPRAAYGMLDTTNGTLGLYRVAYDIQGAQRRILDAGLPEWLAARLGRGQ